MELHQMVATVRLYLDEPIPQHPTQRHIYETLLAHLQNFYNELQNSGQNWNVNSYDLATVPDQAEYGLNIGMGKPIFVLTNYSDPNIHDREIPIVDIENWDYPSPGSDHTGRWIVNEEPYSAMAFAFYGRQGSQTCRIMPTPRTVAQYTIWYTPALEGSSALSSQPLMPEHHYLLISRTAISCLPYCQWGTKVPPDLMAAKMGALQNSLVYMNQQQEDSFQRWRSNLRREQRAPRVLYGQFSDWAVLMAAGLTIAKIAGVL